MKSKTKPKTEHQRLRLEYRKPSELAKNPANWRKHSKEQLAAIEDILSDVGWAGVLLYNARTQRLIDGHARKEVATKSDEPVPVLIGNWSEEDERKILATLDPIAAMAETDASAFKSLTANLQIGSEALQGMLAAVAKGAKKERPEPGAGGDEFDANPELAPTRAHVGDVWLIGRHRLLVGDCTVGENVSRLFGDSRARMVWTDPPYGVSIGAKNKLMNAFSKSNRNVNGIMNDDLSEVDLRKLLEGSFALAAKFCDPGSSWYVACPQGPLFLVFASVLNEMNVWRQTLIWVKNNPTMANLGTVYHWKCEPILFGWLPNGAHRAYCDRKQTNVWEIDRPIASPDHPTIKPLELVERAIEHVSLEDEIVYDPFLGSGTTLIAAHRLNRVCYGCELDPKYADVILRRSESEGIKCQKQTRSRNLSQPSRK